MANTNYFELRLTATVNSLYDYLTNTCLTPSSYLNPIKLGSFIHGQTDNTYSVGKKNIKAIDESLPVVDKTYDAIKWLVSTSEWIDYDSGIKAPKILYIEIVNMNPFQNSGDFTSYHPMTKEDWKGYFQPDDNTNFLVAPNGHLYLSPSDENDGTDLSVLISKKKQNDGIIAKFTIGFTLKVDGQIYSCTIDPLIKVKSPKG